MKKFLAIFLIALVACETVEDLDLEWPKWLTDAWNWVSNAAKNAFNWLKDKGILDAVKNVAISAGKAAAIAWCTPYLSTPVCTLAVNAICSIFGI